MFQVKYAIVQASYSLGTATISQSFLWLGDGDWVDEFDELDETAFFDSEDSAEYTLRAILESEEAHGIDARSLSIVKVLWSDYSDETNLD